MFVAVAIATSPQDDDDQRRDYADQQSSAHAAEHSDDDVLVDAVARHRQIVLRTTTGMNTLLGISI